MVEIRWSPKAIDDLESIIRFYKDKSPKFTLNPAKKIQYTINRWIENVPYDGKIYPRT